MFTLSLILMLVGLVRAISGSAAPEKVAYFTLGRRGGRLSSHENVDLDAIANFIRSTEERYSRTRREFKDNKLALRWRSPKSGTTSDDELLDEPGKPGRW